VAYYEEQGLPLEEYREYYRTSEREPLYYSQGYESS
jgi:hypothetical protein